MTQSPPKTQTKFSTAISRSNSTIGDNISKRLEQKLDTRCIHTITQDDNNSVLSLAANDKYLFSGSQGSKIHVWDLNTFQLVKVFEGHYGSVLDLTISADQQWLFSCSGDGTVRVWDIDRLKCSHLIRSCHDVGDIFSVTYAEKSHLLFFGCQNTSMQWYDFGLGPHTTPPHQPMIQGSNQPDTQKSQFFQMFHDLGLNAKQHHDYLFTEETDLIQCVICTNQVYANAHNGYVYCMAYANDLPNIEGEVIITGSGDGNIKIWSIQNKSVRHYQTLTGGDPDRGILSLAISEDGYLFCGVQGGHVQIWDLETYQLIRSVIAHSDDVLSVMAKDSGFISASADGLIKFWNEGFDFSESVDDHNGIILSMAISNDYLITGSSDHSIKIWDVPTSLQLSSPEQFRKNNNNYDCSSCDLLMYVLERWVSIRTVSGNPQYFEECRRGARFFKNILQQLGAHSQLIPGVTGRNPLIFAKFSANSTRQSSEEAKVPTVLFYGHYDVIAAENETGEWLQDPFKLSGLNGYIYGRGTSDNKGPILASVFAVHELLKEGLLNVNVIFLIEGEEESGSHGFLEALDKHQNMFENIDLIILSNSYWLGEDVPCITYGLRGVIHASVTVSNSLTDLHSGVEGGAVSEPLIDLVHVLGKLIDDDKRVLIPEFYDDVLPVSEAEEKLYDPIVACRSQHSCITSPSLSSEANSRYESSNCSDDESVVSNEPILQTCEQIKKQLMSRWRYPTLTVHTIHVPMDNPTIISHCATSAVSMRIVPNQSITEICSKFEKYVRHIFNNLKSENRISIKIQSSADYWLGNPDSKYFKAAELAIEEEWKVKPLYIREGGSIPAVRWLERFFDAPAIHIPFGQSSDQAHLPNERIRLQNLHAGRKIIKTLLKNIQ
ncbi:hypothetical protein HPULCUR_010812 [Helicostylum pulchrum]|uniref:Peptidase M20 dimerisation domain-containing protein n=1 Tax=Helicostylum pulchrum TaxID=562976 RepID=A0ABP9YG85_9FUNG